MDSNSDQEVVVNHLHVMLKYITGLPVAFQNHGVDPKGALSTNPEDHVFVYTLSCAVGNPPPPPPPVAETPSIAATPTAAVTEENKQPVPPTPSIKNFHDFTLGKYKLWTPEDLDLQSRAVETFFQGNFPLKPKTADSLASSNSAEKVGLLPPELQPCITWLWQKREEEKKEDLVPPKGDRKASTVKSSRKAPPPKAAETEKQASTEERVTSPSQAPLIINSNTCTLDVTAKEWSIIKEKADTGVPLVFNFRRCLRPNTPADWTDINEFRYRAEIPIDLTVFAEPGLCEYEYSIPLQPVKPPTPEVEETDKSDKKKAAGAKKPPAKKGKGGEQPATLTVEEDLNAPHPYMEAGTQIVVILKWDSPVMHLPEHRPRPSFLPADIIPRRIRHQKKAVNCVQAYGSEVKEIVFSLAQEWRSHVLTNQQVTTDKMKDHFQEFLREAGLRNSYKERLKHSIIRIVKEKFNKRTDPSSGGSNIGEIQTFCSELYVYLTDLMHQTLNEMFSRSALSPGEFVTSENRSNDRWKRLADEAEESQDFPLAAQYYQERLVDESSVQKDMTTLWYEYGTFSLRMRDVVKAEQTFKEAIALDVTHLPSLLAYGLLLLNKNLYPESEVFMQAAVDVNIEDPITWVCLGLLKEISATEEGDPYRQKEKSKEASYSYSQSKRLLTALKKKMDDASSGNGASSDGPSDSSLRLYGQSIYLYAADFLLGLHFEQLADHCLENEAKRVGTSPQYYMLLSRLNFQSRNFDQAEQSVKKVLEIQKNNQQAELLMGDIVRELGRMEDAEQLYIKAIGQEGIGITGNVYVRLGNIQMAMQHYEEARDNFLWGAQIWPCGLTWIGLGMAFYRLGDFQRAEQALNEANILNNLNPMIWAYLCLVCIKLNCFEEAERAYEQASKLNLRDARIIAEIGFEHQQVGNHRSARAAFLRSLQENPATETRLLLARTLTQMRQFKEAQVEYNTVMVTAERAEDRTEAQQNLAMLAGVM